MTSQKQAILKHIRDHGSISPMEALNEYGCFRLASRIHELKKDGHNIPKPDISKGYAVYTLGETVQGSLF